MTRREPQAPADTPAPGFTSRHSDHLRAALAHPALAPVSHRLQPYPLPETGPWLFATADGRLGLTAAALAGSGVARFSVGLGSELVTWLGTCGGNPAGRLAAAAGAVHAGLMHFATLAVPARLEILASVPNWLGELLHWRLEPDWAGADVAVRTGRLLDETEELVRLMPWTDGMATAHAARDAGQALLAPLLELACPTEVLLTAGGDSRLQVEPATGRNGYGCSPVPHPGEITFSSCTASSVSVPGFAAADEFRRHALQAGLEGMQAAHLQRVARQQRRALGRTFKLPGSITVLPCPSGTDAELAALWLALQTSGRRRLLSVVVAPGEVGSGTLAAAAGQHFDACTPLGCGSEPGAILAGFAPGTLTLAGVELRDRDGAVREPAAVAAEIQSLVAGARRASQGILLHLLDASKTGLAGPAATAVDALAADAGTDLTVLVDAAQMRVNDAVLAEYLARGWVVMITGSKFFTGPPFSGALLIPASRLPPAATTMPAGLGAYLAAGDLPSSLSAAGRQLPAAHNPGLLARWAAALAEIEAFQAVPAERRTGLLADFGRRFTAAADAVPELLPLPTVQRDSAVGPARRSWDAEPSIFSFLLRPGVHRASSGAPFLSSAEARQVYHWLNADISGRLPAGTSAAERELAAIPCHAGQPVRLAWSGQLDCGALRVAAGARYVYTAARGREAMAAQLQGLDTLLAKAGLVARYWPQLAGDPATASVARA